MKIKQHLIGAVLALMAFVPTSQAVVNLNTGGGVNTFMSETVTIGGGILTASPGGNLSATHALGFGIAANTKAWLRYDLSLGTTFNTTITPAMLASNVAGAAIPNVINVAIASGGLPGSTFVIFQVTAAVGTAVPFGQAIFFNVPDLATPAGQAPITYSYQEFGSALAANNNLPGTNLAAATATAINYLANTVSGLVGGGNAIISLASGALAFIGTQQTQMVLPGTTGTLASSSTLTGALANGTLATPSTITGNLTTLGTTTSTPNGVGVISTVTLPGDPAIGVLGLGYNGFLDPVSAPYNLAAAAGNGDTGTLTITALPGSLAAFRTAPGRVYIDINGDSVFSGGEPVAVVNLAGTTATFAALTPAQMVAGNSIRTMPDGVTVITPSTFNASLLYTFGTGTFVAGTFTNPTFTSAFGSSANDGTSFSFNRILPASSLRMTNNAIVGSGKITITAKNALGVNIPATGLALTPLPLAVTIGQTVTILAATLNAEFPGASQFSVSVESNSLASSLATFLPGAGFSVTVYDSAVSGATGAL